MNVDIMLWLTSNILKRASLCFHLVLQIPCSSLSLILSYVRVPSSIDQEIWVKDAVLAVFPDTRECSPSLVWFVRVGKISTNR